LLEPRHKHRPEGAGSARQDHLVGHPLIVSQRRCLAVGTIRIHRVMRSPLSSRTNSRPERVTPDEFFDLVASSVVMVLPSVSQLPSLNLPSLALFEPHVPPSPVKPGKSRQIAANETGDHARRIRQDAAPAATSWPRMTGISATRPSTRAAISNRVASTLPCTSRGCGRARYQIEAATKAITTPTMIDGSPVGEGVGFLVASLGGGSGMPCA